MNFAEIHIRIYNLASFRNHINLMPIVKHDFTFTSSFEHVVVNMYQISWNMSTIISLLVEDLYISSSILYKHTSRPLLRMNLGARKLGWCVGWMKTRLHFHPPNIYVGWIMKRFELVQTASTPNVDLITAIKYVVIFHFLYLTRRTKHGCNIMDH